MTRRRYEAYRDSGVEWLGEVPAHWVLGRIGYSFLARSGGTPSTSDEAFWEGEIPWVSAKDMKQLSLDDSEDHINERAVRESSTTMVPGGTVLMVTRSGILRHTLPVAVAERPMAINQDVKGLIPLRNDLSSRFFVYLLHGHQNALLTLWRQQGATVESLDFNAVLASQFPLPPMEEQHAIAAFLDWETAKVDALIEKKRLLIERIEEQRTALISRTVTRGLPPEAARAAGLDPSPRLKPSGVEWLGDVPEHWEVDRLRWSIIDAKNGVWGEEPDGEDDLVCVRVADFDRRDLRVDLADPTLRSIPPAQRKERLLERGDLLLEKSGGGEHQLVGCVVSYESEAPAVTSNFVARLRTAPGMVARFWAYLHAALYAGRLNYPAIKQTTGIQNLDASEYFDTRVAFPPEPEQRAVAEYLNAETRRIDSSSDEVRLAIERLQEYRTALITAAVTGKIDVRESARTKREEIAAG